MPRVRVRIAPELRVFVAAEHRGDTADVATDGTSSLGHVVESLGIPLTEVGALRAGGREVPAAHVPAAGEEVAVEAVRRPQRVPGPPPAFLLDVHLGTLARRLRLLGVDAAYENEDIGDPALARWSARERRVLLSRDRGLLRRREIFAGGYVYSDRPEDQLRDVLGRFAPPLAPWTRCVACNGALAAADKDTVSDRLRDGTRKSYDVFARCTACERVYWKGAHHAHLEAVVAQALREYGPAPAAPGPTV
ncbi:hypothetical protein RVR_8228 [Actinacidiphila reveromycinica]|uniref:Mut7-C ubiquitin/RNAse domain-containing protein n=1 Tax=Actinacidiphila reveromycinica TaxID=659352 RepID=A0A7U3VRM5_9ACTN|nr:Mut7-C RNAse domain-containing protein [Streptomyces sp. SN-593]BBB01001.1 hypothetical protein RVR_8228 [Streptomyces sp. SN-593]